MSEYGFLLALISSIFWAGFDATRKHLTRDVPTLVLAFLLIAGQIPFYIIWLFMEPDLKYSSSYWFAGSLCAISNLYANIAFLQSFKMSQISLTIPMLSLTPVFTALISYFTMQEELNSNQIIGILLIVSGSLGIQGAALYKFLFKKNSEHDRNNYFGMLLMTSVALAWSFTATLDKISLAEASPSIHALVQCVLLSIVLFIYLKTKTPHIPVFRIGRKNIAIFIVGLLVAVAALSTQLVAIQKMYVGLFEATKRSAGIVFSIGFGYFLFGEGLSKGKLIGCSVIIAGVWLLFY